VAALAIPGTSVAQQEDRTAGARLEDRFREQASPRPEWVAPISSALIPGSGQLIQGRSRGLVYIIAEVLFLQRFVSHWSEARREEDRYKEIAFRVARGGYAP